MCLRIAFSKDQLSDTNRRPAGAANTLGTGSPGRQVSTEPSPTAKQTNATLVEASAA